MPTPSLFPQFMKASAGATVTGGAVTVVVNGIVKNAGLAGTVKQSALSGVVSKRGVTGVVGQRGITGTIVDGLQGTLRDGQLDGDLK